MVSESNKSRAHMVLPIKKCPGRMLGLMGKLELSKLVLRIKHSSPFFFCWDETEHWSMHSIELQMVDRPGAPWHCHWCHWCSTAWPSHCPGQALPGSRALHPWP